MTKVRERSDVQERTNRKNPEEVDAGIGSKDEEDHEPHISTTQNESASTPQKKSHAQHERKITMQQRRNALKENTIAT